MWHGAAEIGDLAQECEAIVESHLIGVSGGKCFSTAMAAGEGAGLRHLPVNVHWGVREVARGVSHAYSLLKLSLRFQLAGVS